MLRKIRQTLAIVFFVLITLLFLDVTGTLHHYLGWMAKIQFLPAVLALNVGVIAGLIVLTLLLGRIYCSVICPLGVMQDLFGRLGKRAKKNRYTYSKAVSWLRYLMLLIMVAALILGIGSVVALLAPYSAYGRIANNLLQPLYALGNNALASVAESAGSYTFYKVDVWIKTLPVFIIALVTLVALFILAWRNGRTYCNTICPVGTTLSFFSRFSLLKIRINPDKCVKCSLCSRNCKASCIDYKNYKVDYSRCVVCGDCIDKCRKKAISYGLPLKKTTSAQSEKTSAGSLKTSGSNLKTSATNSAPSKDVKPQVQNKSGEQAVDAERRAFVTSTLALGVTTVLAQEKKKVDGGLAEIVDKVAPKRQTRITPPGSISLSNMAKHCTGCQLCVSTCPNNVLRPSTSLLTLMQPESSYERGYCRPECTKCSEVCPAGAIKRIDRAEKSSIQIGHAVWIKKNCIPVTNGVECGNCARHCPVGAITMVPMDANDPSSHMIPTVNEERCIGCGACENLCPSRPFSAIYVEGHEVHRTI